MQSITTLALRATAVHIPAEAAQIASAHPWACTLDGTGNGRWQRLCKTTGVNRGGTYGILSIRTRKDLAEDKENQIVAKQWISARQSPGGTAPVGRSITGFTRESDHDEQSREEQPRFPFPRLGPAVSGCVSTPEKSSNPALLPPIRVSMMDGFGRGWRNSRENAGGETTKNEHGTPRIWPKQNRMGPGWPSRFVFSDITPRRHVPCTQMSRNNSGSNHPRTRSTR